MKDDTNRLLDDLRAVFFGMIERETHLGVLQLVKVKRAYEIAEKIVKAHMQFKKDHEGGGE